MKGADNVLVLNCQTLQNHCRISQEVFDYLLPLLQASVQLLEVYSGTPEVIGVILELFALSAENYIVFLSQV